MTIKTHIAISATISLALIALIACQQKTQAPETKEQNKAATDQKFKVDEVKEPFKQEVKSETINIETKINEDVDKEKEEINKEQDNNNLLTNGNFYDGLKGWTCTKSVNVINDEGKAYLELSAPERGQSQAWQPVNTISGHVYRLSFKSKCDQIRSFVIFRDNENNIEEYLFTNPSKNWKEYQKDFVSQKDGIYRVYLSCKGKGLFYYSDINLIDLSK